MNNPKLLFLTKKRTTNYGVSTGLTNSAQFVVNYLQDKGVDCKSVLCEDGNSIDKEVFLYRPTHAIISAVWVTPVKLRELANKYRNVIWIVRVHSKIPFIANEGIALDWLLQYTEIDRQFGNVVISGNSVDFCESLSKTFNLNVVYLPNIYRPDYKPEIADRIRDGVIDIGCFGAIRPMKNQLIQAMAAIAFANENKVTMRFHINSDRTEQKGDQVLKNIRALFKYTPHTLVEHPWATHYDFLKLVSKMDIGMQVSLTETFNIVCADFVYMGIPIVTSNEISWMDNKYTADPLNLTSIVNALNLVYHCPPILRGRWDIFKLGRYNYAAGKTWLEYIGY